jgi:hypothetical protein
MCLRHVDQRSKPGFRVEAELSTDCSGSAEQVQCLEQRTSDRSSTPDDIDSDKLLP